MLTDGGSRNDNQKKKDHPCFEVKISNVGSFNLRE